MASGAPQTFEEMWQMLREVTAGLKETRAILKEVAVSSKDTDAKFKDTDAKFKDTDAKFKDTDAKFKDTDAKFKDTDAKFKDTGTKIDKVTQAIAATSENIGGLSKKWGDLGEAMTIGETLPLFNAIEGIDVDTLYLNSQSTRAGKQREMDGIAVGDDAVIVMEAKTSLKKEHIDAFINKTLKHFTTILPIYTGKKVYGALGYLSASSKAKDFAHEKGLLLICPVQGNKKLVPLPTGFKLRNFHP